MSKEKFQKFLEEPFVEDKLPIHSIFWSVNERANKGKKDLLLYSRTYMTGEYPCFIFYKPISQCIDLTVTPKKNKN